MKLKLEIDVTVIDKFENRDTICRIFYPDEGNTIQIIKGLNKLEFCTSIFHEVGHLFDWYLSQGKQSMKLKIREKNAEIIEKLANDRYIAQQRLSASPSGHLAEPNVR